MSRRGEVALPGGRTARVVETIVAGEVALQVGDHWHAGYDLPRHLIDAGDRLADARHRSGIEGRVGASYGSALGTGDQWPASDAQALAFGAYNRAQRAVPAALRGALTAAVVEGRPVNPRALRAALVALARHYYGIM